MAIDLSLLCSTNLLTPIAISSTLLILTTPSSPFLSLSFFVFTPLAVKMKTFNPKAWKWESFLSNMAIRPLFWILPFLRPPKFLNLRPSATLWLMSQTTTEPPSFNFSSFQFQSLWCHWEEFHILKNDPETSSIFSNNPLVSFDAAKISEKSLAACPRNCRHLVVLSLVEWASVKLASL